MECTDFKIEMNFWKKSLTPFQSCQGHLGQNSSKLKTKKIVDENLKKLDEKQNLAYPTSKMPSWPQWPWKGLGKYFQKLHFSHQCKEVRFASFLSGRFTTKAVMNPPENKLEKRTSVQCIKLKKMSCISTLSSLFEKFHLAPSEVIEVKNSFSRSWRPSFVFHLVFTRISVVFSFDEFWPRLPGRPRKGVREFFQKIQFREVWIPTIKMSYVLALKWNFSLNLYYLLPYYCISYILCPQAPRLTLKRKYARLVA